MADTTAGPSGREGEDVQDEQDGRQLPTSNPSIASLPITTSDTDDSAQSNARSDFYTGRKFRVPRRGLPGDASIFRERTPEEAALAKRRSEYYNEFFATGPTYNSPREVMSRIAPITVTVRTNVVIRDEEEFMLRFGDFMLERYNRDAVLINLQHNLCMRFGKSFESTYHVTVTALPVWVQPTLNRRNTALISEYLHETIQVPPERGIIHFEGIEDSKISTNGNTVLGEIEKREEQKANYRKRTRPTVDTSGKRQSKRWSMFKEAISPTTEHGASKETQKKEGPHRRQSKRWSVFQGAKGPTIPEHTATASTPKKERPVDRDGTEEEVATALPLVVETPAPAEGSTSKKEHLPERKRRSIMHLFRRRHDSS